MKTGDHWLQTDSVLESEENFMLNKTGLIAGVAMLALFAGSGVAMADDCSGHGHETGTVLGAIAGGLIGSAASHGNAGAVVGGAIVGGLAGNAISRDIDCEDREGASRAYYDSFDGEIGERYEWHGHGHGYVVSNREYYEHGHLCRDFTQVVWHNGEEFTRDGTACRRHGEWQIEMDSD
jgi:surface antigen